MAQRVRRLGAEEKRAEFARRVAAEDRLLTKARDAFRAGLEQHFLELIHSMDSLISNFDLVHDRQGSSFLFQFRGKSQDSLP